MSYQDEIAEDAITEEEIHDETVADEPPKKKHKNACMLPPYEFKPNMFF